VADCSKPKAANSNMSCDHLSQRRDNEVENGKVIPSLEVDAANFFRAYQEDGHDSDWSRAYTLQQVQEVACTAPGCPSPIRRQWLHGMFVDLELPADAKQNPEKSYSLESLLDNWKNRNFDQYRACPVDSQHPPQKRRRAKLTRTGDVLAFRVERAIADGQLLIPIQYPVELDITMLIDDLPSEAEARMSSDKVHLNWRVSGVVFYSRSRTHFMGYRYIKYKGEWQWVEYDDTKEFPTLNPPKVQDEGDCEYLIFYRPIRSGAAKEKVGDKRKRGDDQEGRPSKMPRTDDGVEVSTVQQRLASLKETLDNHTTTLASLKESHENHTRKLDSHDTKLDKLIADNAKLDTIIELLSKKE